MVCNTVPTLYIAGNSTQGSTHAEQAPWRSYIPGSLNLFETLVELSAV